MGILQSDLVLVRDVFGVVIFGGAGQEIGSFFVLDHIKNFVIIFRSSGGSRSGSGSGLRFAGTLDWGLIITFGGRLTLARGT